MIGQAKSLVLQILFYVLLELIKIALNSKFLLQVYGLLHRFRYVTTKFLFSLDEFLYFRNYGRINVDTFPDDIDLFALRIIPFLADLRDIAIQLPF
jgi:hypothetical protein